MESPLALRFTTPPEAPVIRGYGEPDPLPLSDDPELDAKIEMVLNPPDPEAEMRKQRAEQLETLANKIKADFNASWQHREKTGWTAEMIECLRLRKGEYLPKELEAIRRHGGAEHYFNLAGMKCDSAEAWTDDQLGPENYEPEMEPTPISDLPGDAEAEVEAMVAQEVEMAVMSGQMVDPAQVDQLREQLMEAQRQQVEREAREKAQGMTLKIRDQYQEGGFNKAFKDFTHYLTTHPTAYHVGPEVQLVQRAKWNGRTLEVVREPAPIWRAPNPLDVYPAPNTSDLNIGPLCETVEVTRASLEAYLGSGIPGWFDDQIEAVLAGPQPVNAKAYLPDESSREEYEDRDSAINDGVAQGTYCGILYWAEAEAGGMFEAGQEIKALMIGSNVVCAKLNDNPMGKRHYRWTSTKKRPGTVRGEALPIRAKSIQQAACAAARNCIDNLAFASGPMLGIDDGSVEGAQDITRVEPRMIVHFNSMRVKNTAVEPIKFFQADMNVEQLLRVFEFFNEMLDNVTLIPRYVVGTPATGGAMDTASGTSMLMSAASKGLRAILSNIQSDILDPALQDIYLWNLMYLPDDEWGHIKGDCRVKPNGPLQVMSREISDVRVNEIMQKIADNEQMFAVTGLRGLAKLMRRALERQKIFDVVPSDEEMEIKEQQIAQAAQMQAEMEAEAMAGAPQPARKPPTAPELIRVGPARQPTQPRPYGDVMGQGGDRAEAG